MTEFVENLFADARLKLDRAERHLDELIETTLAFYERSPGASEEGPQQADGWIPVYWRQPNDPPIELALICGDVMNNLRAALDHLVYAVASADSGRSQNGTAFPIYRSNTEYRKPRRDGKSPRDRRLKGVSEPHRSIIDAAQPYNERDPDTHPLVSLAWFTNTDKHRLVHPAFTSNMGPNDIEIDFRPVPPNPPEFRVSEDS
jgi:hypothetical protein